MTVNSCARIITEGVIGYYAVGWGILKYAEPLPSLGCAVICVIACEVIMCLSTYSYKSQLDSACQIDKDQWAVTVIKRGHSTEKIDCFRFGHAMLAIEGVKNNKRYTMLAHATDSSRKPKILEISGKIECVRKSQTWSLKKPEIDMLLQSIDQEFAFAAIRNNCTDWVRVMLAKVDIKIPQATTISTPNDVTVLEHTP